MPTIATWNVNGIRAREQQFLDWVARDQPDVICLQEIKATPEQLVLHLHTMAGYWSYWHGAGGYSGVALHVAKARWPERPSFSHPGFDHETRIVVASLGDMDVASIYVPNGGKDYPAKLAFVQAMAEWAQGRRAAGRELVLCGDMNVAFSERDVHPKERKPGAIGQLPEERELFQRVLAAGLTDVGRAQDPDNDGLFTWWPYWRSMRQKNIGWRLDYVLASDAVARRVSACKVLAEIGTSDHAPVLVTLAD